MAELGNRYSLFRQLIVRILLIIGILSMLQLAVSVINFRTVSYNTMIENQSLSFSQAIDNLEALSDQMVYTISQISLNADLVHFLKDTPEDQYNYYASMRQMSEYLSTFSSLSDAYGARILLVGTNGMKYSASMDTSDPLAITLDELYALPITVNMLQNPRKLFCDHLHTRILKQSDDQVVLLGKALQSNYTGKLYGLLYICIKEETFFRQYGGLTSERQRFLIITKDGIAASDSVREQIGKNHMELLQLIKNMPEKTPTLQKWQGRQVFVTASPSPLEDSWLVEISDYDFITRQNSRMMLLIVVLTLLFAVAALLLLSRLISRITKPINELSTQMSAYTGEATTLSFSGCQEARQLSDSYNRMTARIQTMMGELQEQNNKRRDAELAMLQLQIQPHFIYNVLNSIRQLAFMGRSEEVVASCESLSSLLRMTIGSNREMIPLAIELDVLRHYMKLQQIRYGNSIQLDTTVTSPALLEIPVPKLILQPLVENALVHGFYSSQTTGFIRIVISERKIDADSVLSVEILDNGEGMEPEIVKALFEKQTAPQGSDGRRFSKVGLMNVRERLKIIYGDSAKLELYSEKHIGTQVTILFPVPNNGRKDSE